MIKKLICLTAFAATFLSLSLHAEELKKGTIKAFLVKGDDVKLVLKSGQEVPLKRGDVFKDGTSVKTGEKSTAVVILSNGSSVRIGPESEVVFNKVEQAAFDPSKGSYLTLTEDPSQSRTDLKLKNGSIAGETKHLTLASEYVVGTPIGSAGIRGTTFGAKVSSAVVDGVVVYTVTFSKGEGTVTFEAGPAGEGTSGELADGQEITIEGTINEETGTIDIESVSSPEPISPEIMSDLQDLENTQQDISEPESNPVADDGNTGGEEGGDTGGEEGGDPSGESGEAGGEGDAGGTENSGDSPDSNSNNTQGGPNVTPNPGEVISPTGG
ncbi:FecR domain-containing protein [Ruficoccus sp. ZRK36]|uniref:FecR domain-containing protein n=1 Tax=Ruficoccus sp. ZRK36 TaxID=2866311 RepID=UPI001C73D702|nr:FecR domain-containing protein [Ruficoccus sp. ZRK36]QYY34678.1 FecR domain-containing protein [Ruficoccus sp. ZRK36]